MWYLSCLFLLLIIACLTALLGESVLLLIGLKGDRSGSERLALRWLTGSGVLILTAGWLSGCGGVMRGWGPCMTIVLALAALIVCRREGGQTAGAPRFAVSSRNLLVLTALLAAHISLWSLWRDNAFDPYNDYLSTLGQGEYLQDHSFRVPVNPGFGNPVRGIIYWFQVMGFRMGTHYLLALVQSWVPYARSVQVLPAVWAWGVWLCTAGVFLAARWLARIDRRPALLGCLIGAVNLGAPSFSAARGFMNQLYGVAIGLGVLAAVSRAAGGTGRWRRWALLSGVLLATLISAYSELAPIVVLSIILGLLASVRRRSGWLATLWKGLLVAATAAALANMELIRAFHAVKVQLHGNPGGDIAFTGIQYFEALAGTHPGGFEISAWDKILGDTPAAWRWIYGVLHFAVLLTAFAGAAYLLKKRRGAGSALLWANALIFTMLAVYFRFFVSNPWVPGKMGQSWSLFKLTNYAFPLVLIAIGGAGMRGRRMMGVLTALAAICAVAYLPVHDRLSGMRTEIVKLYAGSRTDPFGAYAAFADEVARRSGDRPVYMPLSFINAWGAYAYHLEMGLYYLYPKTVLSDNWQSWSGMYYTPYATPYPNMRMTGQNPDMTALAVVPAGDISAGDQALPAYFALRRSLPFSIKLDNHWSAPVLASTGWRHTLKKNAELHIQATEPGLLALSFRYLCGNKYSQAAIQASDGTRRELSCEHRSRFEPARLEFAFAPGVNTIVWSLTESPATEGNSDFDFMVEELRVQSGGGSPDVPVANGRPGASPKPTPLALARPRVVK